MDTTAIDSPVDTPPVKLDPLQVYKLRKHNQLTFEQIATVLDSNDSTVHKCYQQFLAQIGTAEDVQVYEQAKSGLLSHVEERLIASCLDATKLEKASLNNIAYALTQVHTALRLEKNQSTSNVGLFSRIVQQVDAELFDTKGDKSTRGKKRHE